VFLLLMAAPSLLWPVIIAGVAVPSMATFFLASVTIPRAAARITPRSRRRSLVPTARGLDRRVETFDQSAFPQAPEPLVEPPSFDFGLRPRHLRDLDPHGLGRVVAVTKVGPEWLQGLACAVGANRTRS
jgi:hypothetical protein